MHNIQVFSVCPVLPFIWLQSQFIRGIGPTKSNVAKFSFYLCCRNYTTYILKVHLYHLKTIGSIHWTQPQFSIWLKRQAYEILNIYMYMYIHVHCICVFLYNVLQPSLLSQYLMFMYALLCIGQVYVSVKASMEKTYIFSTSYDQICSW